MSNGSAFDAVAFVRQQTVVQSTPLLPEIRLHLAAAMTPLWITTELELSNVGIAPPFWAFAWTGGQGLARYLLDAPHLVEGKRVLDVASGSGLVAIAAALGGALEVVAVDIDPIAAAATALNALENKVEITTWTRDLTILEDEVDLSRFDLILTGDVCYDAWMASRLLPLLRELADRGATVLIGEAGRAYAPRDGFELLAEIEVSGVAEVESSDVKEAQVVRLLFDYERRG